MGDPHIGFVIAAYAIAFAVLVGMIGAVALDSRRLAARLEDANRALEAARGAKGGRR